MSNCKLVCKPNRDPAKRNKRKFTAKDVTRIINKALENDSNENVCRAIIENTKDEKGGALCNLSDQINCGGLDGQIKSMLEQVTEFNQNPLTEIAMEKLKMLQNFGNDFWDNVFSVGGIFGDNPNDFNPNKK